MTNERLVKLQNMFAAAGEVTWTKSRKSGPYTDNCVEVGWFAGGMAVRDSKDQGNVLLFDEAEWNAFVLGAKDGEFDLA